MKYIKSLLAIVLMGSFFIAESVYALPYSIVANGPLPTSIQPGGIASASYTITNLTRFNPPRNLIKYLPPNVQINQSTSTCLPTSGFALAPGQSCILNLTITGAVSSSNPGPRNHLTVCMSDSITCAGPNPANSLNVVVTSDIKPILYGVSGTIVTLNAPGTSKLYTLDTETANSTLVMSLNIGDDAPVIASDGNSLYYFSGSIAGFKKDPPLLYEIINLKSLTTTVIPVSGQALGYSYGAVFYRNANAFLVSNHTNNFNTLTTSGFNTQIGTMTLDGVTGFACYNHNIYGGTSNRAFNTGASLLQINPANGAILSTTPITLNGNAVNAMQGLTVNPNTGVFYALITTGTPLKSHTGEALQKLVTIDVNTGVCYTGWKNHGNTIYIYRIQSSGF